MKIITDLKKLKVYFPLFSIVFILLCCKQDKNPTKTSNVVVTKDDKVNWLKDNVIHLSSIDPDSIDFADLIPLENILKDIKVVMLGEQSHGDGATFLAKVRLIKFLHQRLGFDILAFESGLYDCNKVWADIKNGMRADTAATKGIFSIWSRCFQIQPLFEYIDEVKESSPLQISGFDCQFTGDYSKDSLLSDLESFLTVKEIQTIANADWTTFRTVLNHFITDKDFIPSLQNKNLFYNTIDSLKAEINNHDEDNDNFVMSGLFWNQMLSSMKTWATYKWDNQTNYNLRDNQMGQNIVWLSEQKYPNQKIIIWAATSHIMRNMNEITLPSGEPYVDFFISMGHTVWQELGNQIYSVGFTGYEGELLDINSREIFQVPPATEGSLEDLLKCANFNYAFLDLRNLPQDGSWLSGQNISRPIGHGEFRANWTRILDALIFTKDLEASIIN